LVHALFTRAKVRPVLLAVIACTSSTAPLANRTERPRDPPPPRPLLASIADDGVHVTLSGYNTTPPPGTTLTLFDTWGPLGIATVDGVIPTLPAQCRRAYDPPQIDAHLAAVVSIVHQRAIAFENAEPRGKLIAEVEDIYDIGLDTDGDGVADLEQVHVGRTLELRVHGRVVSTIPAPDCL
jgi:hypothetical protein